MKRIQLHILDASETFNDQLENIEKAFEFAREKAEALLDLKGVDVVVRDLAEYTIPELGIGGFTPADGHIVYISIDPSRKLDSIDIRAQILHELHHCARNQTYGFKRSLADDLISEGLASLFEEEVTGKRPLYSQVEISAENIEQAKKIISSQEPYSLDEWFYGTKDIPKWFGYSYGYKIVSDYAQAEGKQASDLATEPSVIFFNHK
jgi:uncharacterized protein YjaZ